MAPNPMLSPALRPDHPHEQDAPEDDAIEHRLQLALAHRQAAGGPTPEEHRHQEGRQGVDGGRCPRETSEPRTATSIPTARPSGQHDIGRQGHHRAGGDRPPTDPAADGQQVARVRRRGIGHGVRSPGWRDIPPCPSHPRAGQIDGAMPSTHLNDPASVPARGHSPHLRPASPSERIILARPDRSCTWKEQTSAGRKSCQIRARRRCSSHAGGDFAMPPAKPFPLLIGVLPVGLRWYQRGSGSRRGVVRQHGGGPPVHSQRGREEAAEVNPATGSRRRPHRGPGSRRIRGPWATIPRLQSRIPSQKRSLPSTDLTALTSPSWETIKPTACSHLWQTENTDWWRSPH